MLLLEVNAEWNWDSWFNVYYVRVRRLHSSYKLKYIVWINVTVRCGHRGIEGPALVIPLRLRLHVRINTLRRCILRTVWMHFTQNWWRTYRPQAARITVVTATPQITGNWWILNPPFYRIERLELITKNCTDDYIRGNTPHVKRNWIHWREFWFRSWSRDEKIVFFSNPVLVLYIYAQNTDWLHRALRSKMGVILTVWNT